ncbi:hypothetical protein GCM10010405_58090 [Streptomyces macrosporus]|uniref:Uncharacterized protein n=1 Tax=Streptomyces macrosporus TaxID=44032 RepID=A0ABN3KPV9_9ACTN
MACGATLPRTVRVEGGRVGADRATDRASAAWARGNVPKSPGNTVCVEPALGKRAQYHCTPKPRPCTWAFTGRRRAEGPARTALEGSRAGRAGYCAQHGDV